MRPAHWFFVVAILLVPGIVQAQQQSSLLGAWEFAAVFVQSQGGEKVELWDGKRVGIATFTPDGCFTIQNFRSDLPKLASGSREVATPAEAAAIAGGIYSSFGTFKESRAKHTVTMRILGSTFPNEVGAEQERTYELTGDTLTLVNPTPPSGGRMSISVLKRIK